MQPEPKTPPPVIDAPPRLTAAPQWLAILLSVCLGLFLADAIVSLLDDSFSLFFDLHFLAGIRVLASLPALLVSLLVYVMMAFVPAIPKRWFLPVTVYSLPAFLVTLPFLIYCYQRLPLVAWCISVGQVILGLWALNRLQGGLKFRWHLVPVGRLPARRFGWGNFFAFVLANVLVLPVAIGAYLFFCSGLALDHFSEGFMALHPGGLTVQVRTYARDDGKTIRLFPMSHIADADFYRKVSGSFPTNSIILMEGVTDEQNLITNKISYKRMAKSLGLAEQHEQFKPAQGEIVAADVDVSIFSKDTIDLLNIVMFIHAHGFNAGNMQLLLQYSPSPAIQDELINDLLRKRNAHLLEQIRLYLPKSNDLMVPWGAAHMPGLAQEIQKSGFHLVQSQDYQVIRFHF